MLTLTIITVAIFITYISYIVYRFGILPSISHSWYKLKPFGLQYLFTLFCVSIGFMIIFLSTPETSILWFLSGTGLCFTGMATRFKLHHTTETTLHVIGATGCIVLALLGLFVDYGVWYPLATFLVIGLPMVFIKKFRIKNRDWWLEILGFSTILIGLLDVCLF